MNISFKVLALDYILIIYNLFFLDYKTLLRGRGDQT